ncbi:MAG: hypothetical protein QOH43_572 [Solirubrobacteraceae bacterium]|jgi:hypothetical protein|nr:hypothetical protein [Solirubrobacteraceae bacterium]
MRIKRMLPAAIVVLATAALPIAASAQQSGSDPTARAKFKGEIETSANGTQGTLRVRYRCSAGDTLWISAKQTANGKKDKALELDGSSQAAASWLQSHRNPITCDGKSHTSEFAIDELEQGKGALVEGKAWVQFCITANEQDLTLSKSGWVRVEDEANEDD